MLLRIIKYHRIRDYCHIKSLEVKFATGFTLLFCLSCFFLQVYENFALYESIMSSLLLGIIGGEFALLGMTLAGMAIITSLVTPEIIEVIEKNDNRRDVIGRLMSQFEFSAFNLIFQISYFILLILFIHSTLLLCNQVIFYIIFSLVCYHLFFNIFYILALIGNCIRFFAIKNKCYKLLHIEKTRMDLANEVRIDFLLSIILEEKHIDRNQMLEYLDEMIDKSRLIEKKELKTYLHNYYSGNK